MLASSLPRACLRLSTTAFQRASGPGVLRAVRTDQDTSQQASPQSEAEERSGNTATTSGQRPNPQRLKV